MKKSVFIFLVVLIPGRSLLFAQKEKRVLKECHVCFKTVVNAIPFSFDSTYSSHFGEPFKVHSFKYYVSHIRLVYNDGGVFESALSPHLVDEADSDTKELRIPAPPGEVTGIRFLLGIDSATNVNGVQSGDLDPIKGMFWIWNTGYIMAKLEGSSSSSKAPGKQYSYDIGGFKPGENAAREISLSLAVSCQPSAVNRQRSAVSQPSATYKSSATNHPSSTIINIMADIGKWFDGTTELKIAEQPMCHSPGKLAMQVADNYAAMFSISTE